MALCPCGSGKEFAACCGPVIETVSAPTAEALMRARYTAHTTGAFEFLEKSMAAGTSDNSDNAKMKRWSEAVTWNGLEILVTDKGQEGDETGAVSFIARYAINGIEQEMREDAEFIRENGQWRYLDGAVHGHTPYRRDTPKTGRNDPCPCGSGKKYKKCCGQ